MNRVSLCLLLTGLLCGCRVMGPAAAPHTATATAIAVPGVDPFQNAEIEHQTAARPVSAEEAARTVVDPAFAGEFLPPTQARQTEQQQDTLDILERELLLESQNTVTDVIDTAAPSSVDTQWMDQPQVAEGQPAPVSARIDLEPELESEPVHPPVQELPSEPDPFAASPLETSEMDFEPFAEAQPEAVETDFAPIADAKPEAAAEVEFDPFADTASDDGVLEFEPNTPTENRPAVPLDDDGQGWQSADPAPSAEETGSD